MSSCWPRINNKSLWAWLGKITIKEFGVFLSTALGINHGSNSEFKTKAGTENIQAAHGEESRSLQHCTSHLDLIFESFSDLLWLVTLCLCHSLSSDWSLSWRFRRWQVDSVMTAEVPELTSGELAPGNSSGHTYRSLSFKLRLSCILVAGLSVSKLV